MALTYPAFDELDATRFAALKEILLAVLQAYRPDIDLRRGTIHDLVLHARSLLAATTEQAVDTALSGCSLSEIIADPSLATEENVDRVLGNYRIVRSDGSAATGEVTIILSAMTPVVIPSGLVITIDNNTFLTDATYAARTSEGAVIGANDRLLTAVTGGYAFNVGVEAEEVGEAGNVTRGATATLSQNPFAFVKAFAAADFAGGTDADTNQNLVDRLASGLAVRAWSNRASIEAVLRQQDTFATLKNISVIGFLDPEMLRDQHSIIPISTGGRADLYARTALTYQTLTLRKTATLVSKVGAVGTWQIGLTKDDAPGYYDVVKVLLPTADPTSAGFATSSEVRSLDLTDDGWKPDVAEVIEGTYSAYQSAVIQFADTVTNATALTDGVSQADYDVVVRCMPSIQEMQDFWNLIENRSPMGDVLVKAPIPCFTTATFTVNVKRGYTVDAADVREAVSDAINNLGFSGQVAASYISQVVHNLLGEALYSMGAVTLAGSIRNPDGTNTSLSSTVSIAVADDFENMVSGRTVAFLTTPTAITVTVVVVDPPSV